MNCLTNLGVVGGWSNCIICQKDIDQKPVVIFRVDEENSVFERRQGGNESVQVQDVIKAIKIFSRLLGVLEKETPWDCLNSSEVGPPCCVVCGGALVSILRSQEIIEQHQNIQLEHVGTLKASLALTICNEGGEEVTDWIDEGRGCWMDIRKMQIECVGAVCSSRAHVVVKTPEWSKEGHL